MEASNSNVDLSLQDTPPKAMEPDNKSTLPSLPPEATEKPYSLHIDRLHLSEPTTASSFASYPTSVNFSPELTQVGPQAFS
ncbi:unnamed protein product [Protopolystoma xenopodis]|uniref:Uncharacterized protein n=1 Tax=Protopolystoma xenopodis TaxID=117903 RepID=A0A3S5CTG0_9PLAT|nr:unnamed protein product [Protopolystoma xenopodis]